MLGITTGDALPTKDPKNKKRKQPRHSYVSLAQMVQPVRPTLPWKTFHVWVSQFSGYIFRIRAPSDHNFWLWLAA
jgi:hypothetical protein